MITENNIHAHEMIGLQSEIIQSSNSQIVGLNGTITDETKNMFVINTKDGIKKIPKDNTTWKFTFNGTEKQIQGSSLMKRPHERLGRKI